MEGNILPQWMPRKYVILIEVCVGLLILNVASTFLGFRNTFFTGKGYIKLIQRKDRLNWSLTQNYTRDPILSQTVFQKEKNEVQVHERKRNSFLVITTSGGLGNQIHGILQALVLSRHCNLTFVLPPIKRRFNTFDGRAMAVSMSQFFSVNDISRVTEFSENFDEDCNGKVEHVVKVVKGKPSEPEKPFSFNDIPVGPHAEVCYQVGGPRNGENYTSCAYRVLQNAKYQVEYVWNEKHVNQNFMNTMRNLARNSNIGASKQLGGEKPKCVLLVGNSYQWPSNDSYEYLYSFMHYLSATKRTLHIIKQNLPEGLRFDNMAVLHLRYDEYECFRDKKNLESGKVCLGSGMERRKSNTMYWASMSRLTSALRLKMKENGISYFYLAASPYVPTEIKNKLTNAMNQTHILINYFFSSIDDHDEMNLIERELSIQSKVFIGDYSGTWSGSIYYKRRTLNKHTEWSSNLIQNMITDEAYTKMTYLKTPIELEKLNKCPIKL